MSDERIVVPGEARGLAAALARQPALARRVGPPRRAIVGIAGESGSGKTVTAVALAEALGADRTVVLHQDAYFHRPPRANHAHRCRDLGAVGPQEVNLALLAAHLAAFRAGAGALPVPRVDRDADRFETATVRLAGVDRLVVEGTYVLTLDDLDLRVFLAATHEDTRDRRRRRARDPDLPIIDRILAIEHAIIAAQSSVADVVIDREFRIVGARDADTPARSPDR